MSTVIDLPPPPWAAGRDHILAGAQVTAYRVDGTPDSGSLQSLSGPLHKIVLLRHSGEVSTIPFSSLRYLLFSQSLEPAPVSHPLAQRSGDVTMPAKSQTFRIAFRDGAALEGRTRGSVRDAAGLHLFQERDDGVFRLFIPIIAVKKFEIGPPLDLAQPDDAPQETQPEEATETASDIGPIAGSLAELRSILDRPSGRGVPSKPLGQMMVDDKLITPEQLQNALTAQASAGGEKRLGEVLEDIGDETIHRAVARKLGLPFVRLRSFDVDPAVLTDVPAELARKYMLVPLFIHKDRLVVAAQDPLNTDAVNVLRFVTGRNIEVAVATQRDLELAIERYYRAEAPEEALKEIAEMESGKPPEAESAEAAADRMAREKPIVRLVQNLILDAIRRGASDIHIRPGDNTVDLLYRIDGSLISISSFSKVLLPAVVSRIKIIGRMNIAERRMPQDGQARVVSGDTVVDLRFSVMPSVLGESVVIRVLYTQAGLKTIEELGFTDRDREIFVDLLQKSFGMFLVTGPTGSGKSTTIYAALNEIRKQNVNIITIEDPVEYHIQSIVQMQVNTTIGYTFARALRHILRHDPDIIMVGEIRDKETAEIAVQSALTGHLVLSTLHTNSATATVVRLLDMGIEPFLVNSAVQGVLAQRLVRRNCPKCIAVEAVEPHIRKVLGVGEDEVFYRGKGCDECNGTGYLGRFAVYELMVFTPGVRACIVSGASADQLRTQAIKDGMTPLMENALSAARQRKTSLAEVYSVRLE